MKKHLNYFLSLLSLFLILLSLAIFLGVNSRFLYYLDVNLLKLVQRSGYSKQTILRNYNILIDYLSPFYFGKLQLEGIIMSDSGESHFKDVKNLINFFYLTGFISLIVFIVTKIVFWKEKIIDKHRYLKDVYITYIIIISIILIASIIDFYSLFILFHNIAFTNQDWLFDPAIDPIITILPQDFFMHAALLICLYLVISLVSCYLLYKFYFKTKDKTLK